MIPHGMARRNNNLGKLSLSHVIQMVVVVVAGCDPDRSLASYLPGGCSGLSPKQIGKCGVNKAKYGSVPNLIAPKIGLPTA